MPEVKGGCLCGGVRYSASGDPVFVGVCHCRDCQKFTGSAFSVVIGLPKPTLSVEGTLGTFTKPGDSGKPIHRRFCPTCGASVLDEAEALPNMVLLARARWTMPAGCSRACRSTATARSPGRSLPARCSAFRRCPVDDNPATGED